VKLEERLSTSYLLVHFLFIAAKPFKTTLMSTTLQHLLDKGTPFTTPVTQRKTQFASNTSNGKHGNTLFSCFY
jgi:hypothetical protein